MRPLNLSCPRSAKSSGARKRCECMFSQLISLPSRTSLPGTIETIVQSISQAIPTYPGYSSRFIRKDKTFSMPTQLNTCLTSSSRPRRRDGEAIHRSKTCLIHIRTKDQVPKSHPEPQEHLKPARYIHLSPFLACRSANESVEDLRKSKDCTNVAGMIASSRIGTLNLVRKVASLTSRPRQVRQWVVRQNQSAHRNGHQNKTGSEHKNNGPQSALLFVTLMTKKMNSAENEYILDLRRTVTLAEAI